MEFVTRNFKFHFDVNSPKYFPKPKGDFNRMKARPLMARRIIGLLKSTHVVK